MDPVIARFTNATRVILGKRSNPDESGHPLEPYGLSPIAADSLGRPDLFWGKDKRIAPWSRGAIRWALSLGVVGFIIGPFDVLSANSAVSSAWLAIASIALLVIFLSLFQLARRRRFITVSIALAMSFQDPRLIRFAYADEPAPDVQQATERLLDEMVLRRDALVLSGDIDVADRLSASIERVQPQPRSLYEVQHSSELLFDSPESPTLSQWPSRQTEDE